MSWADRIDRGDVAGRVAGHAGLRVWCPETDDEEAAASGSGSGLSPAMTLEEFFEAWYLPVVLRAGREPTAGTLLVYRDALGWWRRLVGDVPIAAIDARVLAEFTAALRAATYARGLSGAARRLSASSQQKLVRQLRAVLARIGPTLDARRPCAAVVEQAPYLVGPRAPRLRPKAAFEPSEARRLVASTADCQWPPRRGRCRATPPDVAAPRWWSAFFQLLYHTGLRLGTVLALEWSMLRTERGRMYLEVPDDAVSKVRQGVRLPLHPAALAAVERARTASPRMLPWPYSRDYIAHVQKRLCRDAALPPDKQLSPHAWRRTFGCQMALAGAKLGVEVAQRALCHADPATTLASYVGLDDLILSLPPLVGPARDDGRQQVLFT